MGKAICWTYFLSFRVPFVSLGSLQFVFFLSNISIELDTVG